MKKFLSKRMRGSMDNSLDEYHSANDESFVANNNSSTLIASPTPTATATAAARKQLTPSSDPNEPAKPLSAYALFFRDTVSAIKQQNPNCSFQEISRIVASMWEALDPSHKNVYNKKNEMAKNEYIKQMRIYRQQQLEQQQLAQNSSPPIQTRPAVFTITRKNSDSDGQTYGHNSANHQQNNSPPQQQHIQAQNQQSHYQQQFEMQQQQNYNSNHNQQTQQSQVEQQQQQQQQQNNSYSTTTTNCVDSQPPPAQQIQLLTEAGSVQKCIRDHCSKRAIINPDWEDEYCSNECVVIHCRNVFNSWVQANLDARTQ